MKTLKQIAAISGVSVRRLRTLVKDIPLERVKERDGYHYDVQSVIQLNTDLENRVLLRKTKDKIVTVDGIEYQTLVGIGKGIGKTQDWLRKVAERGGVNIIPVGDGIAGNRYPVKELLALYNKYKTERFDGSELSITNEVHNGHVISVLDNNDFIFKSDHGIHLDCRFHVTKKSIKEMFELTKEEILNIVQVTGGVTQSIVNRGDGYLSIFFTTDFKIKDK